MLRSAVCALVLASLFPAAAARAEDPAVPVVVPNAPLVVRDDPAVVPDAPVVVPPSEVVVTPTPRTPVTLWDDAAAQAELSRCLTLVQATPNDALRTCLQGVTTTWPDSLAATHARADLTMLDAWAHASTVAAPTTTPAPGATTTADATAQASNTKNGGRVELVSVAGLFGVWNAIAGTTMLSTKLNFPNSGALLVGVSAASLVAGVGFGVGGYALAEGLHLHEGDARLVASGLLWGTNVGIPMAYWLNEALHPSATDATLVMLGTVLGGGWIGGAAALGLTQLADFDAAQVSMINSGGAIGSFLGVMGMVNLSTWGLAGGVGPYALTYIAGNLVGLGVGGLLAHELRLSWGETLLGDLGAVTGGLVVGLGTAGTLLAFNAIGSGPVAAAIITGAPSLGVVGGYAAGLAVGSLLLHNGPLLRDDAWIAFDTPTPQVVQDKAGEAVQIAPLVALRF